MWIYWQMYNDIYAQLQCNTEYLYGPKNPVLFPLITPTQSLATTDIFTISTVLNFLECHIDGLIQYVALSY